MGRPLPTTGPLPTAGPLLAHRWPTQRTITLDRVGGRLAMGNGPFPRMDNF